MKQLSGDIAVVGDLHSAWDSDDVAFFNGSDYGLVLVTGDLGATTQRDGVRIAKSISRIRREVLVMLGNNDVIQHPTLQTELTFRRGSRALLGNLRDSIPPPSTGRPLRAPDEPEVRACGYSLHPYQLGKRGFTIVAGRPFSLGGPHLTFGEELAREFGVASLEASRKRLRELVDRAPTDDLIFLSHNGPTGLGTKATDPWGNDFNLAGGDWGDPDLADAVDHAITQGRRVLAVIAGHMHSPTREGDLRLGQVRRDGVLYLNPARVPRIFENPEGDLVHHHVSLRFEGQALRAEERLVRA